MLKKLSQKKRGHFSKNILSDPKQYISFFVALLIIQTIFWTLLITTGVNNRTSDEVLKAEYKYHFYLKGISETSYVNLQNVEILANINDELAWPQLEYLGEYSDDFGTTAYKIGVILDDSDPEKSYKDLWFMIDEYHLAISEKNAEFTPLYTQNPVIRTQTRNTYRTLAVVFAIAAAIFFALVNKFKEPKRVNEKGDRIYASSARDSMYLLVKRVFFILMVLSSAASFVFLTLLLSIGNGIAYFFLYIALFLICALFLTELFNTQVNHYKFRYAIYMTFGADFRKLYSTAVKEMLAVSVFTLLPSLGLSAILCALIYAPLGISIYIPFGAFIGVAVLTLLSVLAATYIPMKKMSIKLPSYLLSAEDNSNFASSPRRSFDLLGKSFPFTYELRSIWRFRKYFLRLVAIAVSFSTVFLSGLYLAHINSENAEKDVHEFEITAKNNVAMSDQTFENIDYLFRDTGAFKYFFWKDYTFATDLKIHALINDENVVRHGKVYNIEGNSSERSAWMDKGYSNTTDSFEIVAYNKALLDTISNNDIYNIEGDVYSVLDSNNTIIVSEYIANLPHFDFEVGDSVIIAVPGEKSPKYDPDLIATGKNEQALKNMIPRAEFTYKEYKIGAIIDYGGGDSHFIIGLNTNAYKELSLEADPKSNPLFMQNILVYANKNATSAELAELRTRLDHAFADHGYKIDETYNVMASRLSVLGGDRAVILTVSFLIMLISPLIWFFSQLRFYTRRSKEMFILKALGATERKIMKLYLVSGAILALLSAVLTVALSYVADYVIYLFCMMLVPSMSSVSGVTVSFYMPPAALIICIASSVICGFFSSYLPFVLKRFMRSKSETYTTDGQ